MNKINFVNNNQPAINATNLNQMQTNIENAIDESFECSTSEKKIGKWIDNKPIYRKIINIGNLPNANYSNVAHNINNLNKVIKIYGNATNGTLHLPLPFVSTVSISSNVGININGNYITINSGTDRSSFSGYVIIEYTKTTD